METKNKIIERFIWYLDQNLPHTGFKRTSPRTFFYRDDDDTIFVYISDTNLLIVNDGRGAVDGFTSIRLNLPEIDNRIFEFYRQQILDLF